MPNHANQIRSDLIEALAFPERVMRDNLELIQCPHNGDYDREDSQCRACESGPECLWLSHFDQNTALSGKETRSLVEALEFCYGYLDARLHQLQHKPASCPCDHCAWLRRTERLLDRVVGDVELERN